MKPSLRLGTPFGIAVGAHWTAVLVGALATWSLAGLLAALQPDYPGSTYWVAAVLTVVLYFGGLLAHELAHAIVARRHGIGTKGVTLWALGGLAELERQPDTPKVELRVALAGPLMSMLVGAGFLGLAAVVDVLTDAGVLVTALFWLAVVNGVLGVFNLLPARPMDGGRVLTALLWKRHGDRVRAMATASRVARVVAVGMAALGAWQLAAGGFGGLWLLLIAWFVFVSAGSEQRVLQWQADLRGLTAGQVMGPPPVHVPAWNGLRDTLQEHAGRTDLIVAVRHDGQPAGLVTTAVLARAAAVRPDAALAEVARPIPPEAVAHRPELLDGILDGSRPTLLPLLVLDDDGRVVGAVHTAELERWARYRREGAAHWPAPTPPRVPTHH